MLKYEKGENMQDEAIVDSQSYFPKMEIEFLGAVGSVTGSCTMLTYTRANDSENYKFLIDVGSYQGESFSLEAYKRIMELVPTVKKIFITHAHIDHIGLLPDIIEAGFTGKICCTKATASLMIPLLYDAMKVSYKYINSESIQAVINKIKSKLYIFDQTEDFVWGQRFFSVTQGVQVGMLRAGHVLGAVSYYFRYCINPELAEDDLNRWKIIHFSGDVSSSDYEHECSSILKASSIPFYSQQSSFIVMESTYGSRERNKECIIQKRQDKLFEIIEETYSNDGAVLIPTFAFNRAQEILIDLECISRNHPVENTQQAPDKETLEKDAKLTIKDFLQKYQKLTEKDIKNLLDENTNYKNNLKINHLPKKVKEEIFCYIQKLYTPSPEETLIPKPLNVSFSSNLISYINRVFMENLFDSFMTKDGIIKTKYLNTNLFTRLGLDCVTDSDTPDEFKRKMNCLRSLLSKILTSKIENKNNKAFKKQNKSVILASSGMCDEGKVMEILPHFLTSPNCVIILTGYQGMNTNGLLLKQLVEGKFGDDQQYMYNKHFNGLDLRLSDVKCKIIDMSEYYSGHADCEQLCNYVHGYKGVEKHENTFTTKVFLNHGTQESRETLKEKIEELNEKMEHSISVILPEYKTLYGLRI